MCGIPNRSSTLSQAPDKDDRDTNAHSHHNIRHINDAIGPYEDQESYLISSIENKVNEALSKTQSYEIIQETFNGLIRLLSHLVNEQELLVDKLVSKENLVIDDGPETKDSSGDVDLF